jgi:hypothetical protein
MDEWHIARLKRWSHRHEKLGRALGEAFKTEDRDVVEMLKKSVEKSLEEYTDIFRSSLPEQARAQFDEDSKAAKKDMEAEKQRLNAEFEAAMEEYRATGSEQRLLAYIADT